LLYLINDILDLSKIEAGKLKVEKIPLQIRTITDDVISFFLPRASTKGIRLYATIDVAVPDTIEGAPTRLRQILNNLIGNAIKFTWEGEISITVEVVEKVDQVAVLKFNISDTGIGITEADKEKLFKPFMQVDASTTRKYGGSGLGLAISRELVEIMGGEIDVSSIPGKGSTFYFTIKGRVLGWEVQEKPQEGLEERIENPALVSKQSQSLEVENYGPRILLIEDNQINQKLVTKMLKNNKLSCDISADGQEALKIMAQKDYDLVFMDCQMPVMDGYECTARIRSMEGDLQHTTIIAMTANAMEGDREKCLQAGMDDYISKPIHLNTQLGIIQKYVPNYK
jgi:two-component system, sensor histidine kinase and response regulator